MSDPVIKRALVSVTDKTGVVEFCRALADEFGVEIVSTGGTAKALADAGVPVRPIDDLTGFPEMMDGRVKTLHPRVHGGLLARRDVPEHMAAAEEHGIGMIDLVCVNLYAVRGDRRQARASPRRRRSRTSTSAGRRMLRSRGEELRVRHRGDRPGRLRRDPRRDARQRRRHDARDAPRAARPQVFRTTSAYDNAILQYLRGLRGDDVPGGGRASASRRCRTCATARTRTRRRRSTASRTPRSTRWRAPSSCTARSSRYNNILDTDAALDRGPRVRRRAGVRHREAHQPVRHAIADDLVDAYDKAHAADPISAYGGVMAFNRPVPASRRRAHQRERAVRRGHDRAGLRADALALLAAEEEHPPAAHRRRPPGRRPLRVARGRGRHARPDVATRSPRTPRRSRSSTKRQPTDEEMEQLLFAWKVAKSREEQRHPAGEGLRERGRRRRSDEPRGLREDRGREGRRERRRAPCAPPTRSCRSRTRSRSCAAAGVTAVIQPGGSVRDEEVIAQGRRARRRDGVHRAPPLPALGRATKHPGDRFGHAPRPRRQRVRRAVRLEARSRPSSSARRRAGRGDRDGPLGVAGGLSRCPSRCAST